MKTRDPKRLPPARHHLWPSATNELVVQEVEERATEEQEHQGNPQDQAELTQEKRQVLGTMA